MALKYHPDVRCNSQSTNEERQLANDDFSRINAAYAFLSGKSADRPSSTDSEKKNGGGGGGSKSRSGSGSGTSGGGYGYTPPHRRTAADQKSYSTDWKDYMPQYDDETQYETNGDSFSSIFSDLFSEIGSGSSSSSTSPSGILNDFISFLEGNFPSVGTAQTKEEDIILESLLRNGGWDEVKNEFDDAKLLVKQLEQKEIDLDKELEMIAKEVIGLGGRGTYMEAMGLEERKKEVEARKAVVGDYLDRARMRQLKLRKRCDELRMEGGGGRSADSSRGGERRSSSSSGSSTSGGSSSSSTGSYSSGTGSGSSSSTSTGTAKDESAGKDSWKRESYGSRRRGSGRSRPSSTPSGTGESSSSSSSQSSSTRDGRQNSEQSTYASGSTSSSSRTYASTSTSTSAPSSSSNAQSQQVNIPPHRRIASRYEQVQEDKRRLREIKVDEEIEKMKKELGL